MRRKSINCGASAPGWCGAVVNGTLKAMDGFALIEKF